MKPYEFTGVNAQKDMLQLLTDISGEGSKSQNVGSGANAQVLSHSNGMIYKFWAKDSAYESFINYVEKNQADKHLPKLKSKVKELHEIVIINSLANDEDMGFNDKLFKQLKKLNKESRGIKDDE